VVDDYSQESGYCEDASSIYGEGGYGEDWNSGYYGYPGQDNYWGNAGGGYYGNEDASGCGYVSVPGATVDYGC
jgi:hypothetical protein